MTHASLVEASPPHHRDGDFGPGFVPATNAQLKELVTASGLSSAVSMTIFNRGLGAAACTETQWKSFLAEPDSSRFLALSAEQLAHAVHQFARIGVHREVD